jgi:hypothetical protein
VTDPFPLPDDPLVIVIHDPDRDAVHEQPADVETVTLPVAAGRANVWLVGVTMKVHDPLCVTANVADPIATVADRTVVPEFAATL